MLKLKLDADKEDPLKILLLGAHSDDIEIGLGGTILRLADEYPNLAVTWVVFSATGDRAVEARKSAEDFLQGVPNKQIFLKEFKDGYFPSRVADIKDVFEELKKSLSPDVIFTHYRNDLHQDHRQLNELTWNTWRDHFILEYEIPKYDGDLGNPNFFVALDDELCERKTDLLMRHFQTQSNKHWFSPETFNALMRLRGVECKSTGGYAEAFYGRKVSF
ncbi:MAG: PIG-L domain-containing protein [Anaerolineales bacterium]|nr:MAG: PIG-L domain-containing protein [Anaerolineales bacterium]